jgi:hypothetical protein
MAVNFSNHKALDTYVTALSAYQAQGVTHEQATRLAFSTLLDTLSKEVGTYVGCDDTVWGADRATAG